MKEKNIFDVLENTDSSVIDRLAAEFPPKDNKEKEKIFKMSERKFNTKMNNISKADEQSVSGVEIYKKPKWQRFLSIAAAFAIVSGGITGGAYALKHLKGTQNVNNEHLNDAEKKIAPFGDFSELGYRLCDYNDETAKHIITQNDDSAKILLTIFSGPEISQSKRQKLADFFNNYDYKELPEDTSVGQTVEIDISRDNITDEPPQEKGPSFVFDDGNEARITGIYKQNGIGVLIYTIFHYEERDGKLYMTDKEVTECWQIDYDLFNSTINEILSAEDEIEVENGGETPVKFANCPFDFTAYDFVIPDLNSATSIEVTLDMVEDEDGSGYHGSNMRFPGGNVIPLEKRQKLAEFFDTLNWEETDDLGSSPNWLHTYEEFGTYCITDDEVVVINLDRDTSTLQFSQVKIELEMDTADQGTPSFTVDDDYRYISYRAVDYNSEKDKPKLYKIDYDLFKSKMKEILGDDFCEPARDEWSFFSKEWRSETDENNTVEPLSTNDKYILYDLLKNCSWKEGEQSSESLSKEEAINIYQSYPSAETDKYVILTGFYMNYNDIIYFEQYDDKTVVRYYDYGVQGANIPGEEYIVNIYNYTCDDAELVQKIKECLNNNTAVEVPVDLSIVDKVKWLYTSFDTRSFNISVDKMEKIGECLKKYNWSMIDENSYFGYYISIVGEWKYYLVDLQIGKDWDENTIIRFNIGEPAEMDGHKFLGATVNNALEFGNKLYISNDKNAYNELKKILSE